MQKHDDTEMRDLTVQEINRQVRELNSKRQVATENLAAMYKARLAGQPEERPIDDHTKVVRARAIQMLNGHAASVLQFPHTPTREQELRIEVDAIDLVIKALGHKEIVARAAEAAQWTIDHRAEWVALCREIILTAIRIQSLSERAAAMLAAAPEGHDLPATAWFGNGLTVFRNWDFENPLQEPVAAAIKANIITMSDARKTHNVD